MRCHAGQLRESDGASFIEHPLEVARLLRDAGCSAAVVAAGLLHDVIEDAHVSRHELSARFGPDVARLVTAVTDEGTDGSYRQRKQALRAQVRDAGSDAVLVFAADKISKVRELPEQLGRDRARFGPSTRDSRARNHLDRYREMRLEHYRECLKLVQDLVPRHPLVAQLASELDACPAAIRADMRRAPVRGGLELRA